MTDTTAAAVLPHPYTYAEIAGAVARGWCHAKTATKVMDPELASAIADEVRDLVIAAHNALTAAAPADHEIDAICAPGRADRWRGDGRQYDRDTARLVLRAFAQPTATSPVPDAAPLANPPPGYRWIQATMAEWLDVQRARESAALPGRAGELRKAKDAVLQKLVYIQLGGCSCMTKTPETQYHKERCHYRLANEAADLVEALAAQPVDAGAVQEVARLTAALKTSNANHERFERGWYLRGDALEMVKEAATDRRGLDFNLTSEQWVRIHEALGDVAAPAPAIEQAAGGGTAPTIDAAWLDKALAMISVCTTDDVRAATGEDAPSRKFIDASKQRWADMEAHLRLAITPPAAVLAPTPERDAFGWYVYIPSQQRAEFFDDQNDDEYVDILTNGPYAQVTPLFERPAAVLEAPAGQVPQIAPQGWNRPGTLSGMGALPVAPQGWKLVPIESTSEMREAALTASLKHGSIDGVGGNNALPIGYELYASRIVYAAMLAAAPSAPSGEPEQTR